MARPESAKGMIDASGLRCAHAFPGGEGVRATNVTHTSWRTHRPLYPPALLGTTLMFMAELRGAPFVEIGLARRLAAIPIRPALVLGSDRGCSNLVSTDISGLVHPDY